MPIRPTIIIGIGGVGKNILLRTRRKVVEDYRSLDALPSLRFLHVDTFQDGGPEEVSDIPNIVLGENLSFRPHERVIISNAPDLGNPDIVKANSKIMAWFPDSLPINDVTISLGAGAVRPYGRLAFHYSVDDFRQTLTQAIGDVFDFANWKRTVATLGIGDSLPNEVDVYVVSSFFGGTGSGCFYEVCYNTKYVMGQMGRNHLLLGFFVIGASNPNDTMKANCYSALKELQHYSTVSLDDSLHSFNVSYPIAGIEPLNSNKSSVDYCFLLDSQNRAGMNFSREELEEAVAARIFFEFVPGIATQLRARRVDVTGQTDGFITPDTVLNKAQSFLGTGLSVVEYPAPRIKNALAYSFAADVCQYLLFPNAPGFVDRDVSNFIRNNRLLEDDLISDLQQGRGAKNTVDNDLFNARQRVNDVIGNVPFYKIEERKESFNKATIDNTIATELEAAQGKVDLNKGQLIGNIKTARDGKLKPLKDSINTQISQWVCDNKVGPVRTKEFIEKVINELETLKGRLKARGDGLDASINKSSGRVQDRIFRIRDDMEYKYHKELKKGVEWLFEKELKIYMYNCIDKASYQEGEGFVAALIQFLAGQVRNIESYEGKLRGWIIEFGYRIGDISQNLSQARNIVDIQGSSDQIRNKIIALKSNLIPDGATSISEIINDVQTALAEKPFKAVLEKEKEFKEVLLSKCETRFTSVDGTSVAPFLDDNLVGNKAKEGRVFLRVEGLDNGTSHITMLNQRRWVMVPEGSKAHFPAGYHEVGAEPPYRAIFAEEIAVFPLRCLTIASNQTLAYKGAYDRQGKDTVRRGTDKRIRFDDIVPPDPRIPELHERASKAYHLGRALELLQKEQKNGSNAIYLRYHDILGEERWDEIYVAQKPGENPWGKVEKILAETQVDKDVHGRITGDTHLEILNREIDSKVGKATSFEEKQKISNALQKYQDAYLDDIVQAKSIGRLATRIEELEGQGKNKDEARNIALQEIKKEATTNASYQKIVGIFSQFRLDKNLP